MKRALVLLALGLLGCSSLLAADKTKPKQAEANSAPRAPASLELDDSSFSPPQPVIIGGPTTLDTETAEK